MTNHTNELGQPIGFPLPGWTARRRPQRVVMTGRTCRIEPLDRARHAADLFAAYAAEPTGRDWTYLTEGPFANEADLGRWAEGLSAKDDPLFFAIVEAPTGKAAGVASYRRIDPAPGVIEVGGIHYAPALQGSVAATEAMYLMMRHVFADLGYRRYEWKCDALNERSRAAAERLGFRYEGLFRQATVYRARNRDTAWFAVVDGEWPALRARFERWLDPANFDARGRQRKRLEDA